MNLTQDQSRNLRVANFSNINLQIGNQLSFNAEDPKEILREIRNHSDLPYIFVVSRDWAQRMPALLTELRKMRSPCYPYALFLLDGAEVSVAEADLDIIPLQPADARMIYRQLFEYARNRFDFDNHRLRVAHPGPLPASVDVAIVGAGITGLYAARRFMEAGLSVCILEKRDLAGGIWSRYANRHSQVNTSECAYRLLEQPSRSNHDHSPTFEILEDIARLVHQVAGRLFLSTEVEKIEKKEACYKLRLNRGTQQAVLESKGVILAINDRVGKPREIRWNNQAVYRGQIVSGFSDGAAAVDWRDKNVVVVGMGAFAIENTRTALREGARHVTVICRRHGTVCPKIIDYLNFVTPYDDAFKHDKKSNLRNMMYWKKVYELSGAKQPESWMGKIKHEGHTISVSDIWFIGHYLKKIKTITGAITGMTESGVIVNDREQVAADIVVNCIGFERNSPIVKSLCDYPDMYNSNYIDRDIMYLADAYIDDDAFNSLFGSSVLEMVKFYLEVYLLFFQNTGYDRMQNTEGIEKIPIQDRKWSHYIKGAMALIQHFPEIRSVAQKQVDRRTKNFLEIHDLATYIAQNKREWIDTHSYLAGKPMKEEECLPFVFDKLL